jgi:outer membrane protein assembly factor BamD (BamD/ComL family)
MNAANTARSGIVAIREEYDAALKANSIKTWELFIARHPNSPWTEDAKMRLAALKKAQDGQK